MAILHILQFPDPKLKLVAKPVLHFDSQLKKKTEDMFDTMYNESGVGLAAIQVNIQQSIIVIDISELKKSPIVLINPIIKAHDGKVEFNEGCLSFRGVYAKVLRYQSIHLEFQDIDGQMQDLEANGLFSICIQHEIDHLQGITFYDHLSDIKQRMIRKKLEKLKKLNQRTL